MSAAADLRANLAEYRTTLAGFPDHPMAEAVQSLVGPLLNLYEMRLDELDALRARVAELEEQLDSERRDNDKGYNDRS